jgi:hypothetical protein
MGTLLPRPGEERCGRETLGIVVSPDKSTPVTDIVFIALAKAGRYLHIALGQPCAETPFFVAQP